MAKVQAGETLASLSAAEWNRHVDAADALFGRKSLGDGKAPPVALPVPTDIIKVKNLVEEDLPRGSVVQVGDKLIDELTRQALWFEGLEPDEPCGEVVAILRQPLPENIIGEAQVSGVCLARVNVTDTDHRYAYPVSGETVLQSGHGGPFQLLIPATGVEEAEFPVVFGQPAVQQRGIAVLTATLNQGSSAAADELTLVSGTIAYTGRSLTLWDWQLNGGESVPSGTKLEYFWACDRFLASNPYCAASDTLPEDLLETEGGGGPLLTENGQPFLLE